MDEKIIKCKKEKVFGIFLVCRPLILFGLRFLASLIFWCIIKGLGSSDQLLLIKNKVNWMFGILLLFYIFALPVGIALIVDANGKLKNNIKK